jgi:hypothetical protein
MRDICSMRAEPMNLLGLKSGDPVCRPIGFRCFRLSLHVACAAEPEEGTPLAFKAARHHYLGPIP